MIHKVRHLSFWLVPVCVFMAWVPAQVQARHRLDHGLLLPAVEDLHFQVVRFERLAGRRWFPAHEQKYIEIMVKRSHRLVEGVAQYAPRGRVLADYNVLKAFIRTVDRRLSRRSAAHVDHRLMKAWESLTYDFEGIACLINGCSGQCGYHCAGHRTRDFIGPRIPPTYGHPAAGPVSRPLGGRRHCGSHRATGLSPHDLGPSRSWPGAPSRR